jgi:hypothetical protein
MRGGSARPEAVGSHVKSRGDCGAIRRAIARRVQILGSDFFARLGYVFASLRRIINVVEEAGPDRDKKAIHEFFKRDPDNIFISLAQLFTASQRSLGPWLA